MHSRRSRTTTLALVFLYGVLALGDRGLHALLGFDHAATIERGDVDDHRGEEADGGSQECSLCHFLAQSQVFTPAPVLVETATESGRLVLAPTHLAVDGFDALPAPRGPPVLG